MRRPLIKILIVDGRPMFRAGMRALLRAPYIRVVGEVVVLDQVLRMVAARRPHQVLLGYWPYARVLAFLRRLKRKYPTVSVVVVASSESRLDAAQAVAIGCSGYLRDDVGREELLKALCGVARGECLVEPALLQGLLQGLRQEKRESAPNALGPLTVTQREVLRLITEGLTNRQIAQRLGYSVGTVKDYVQKIIRKLEVSDRTQAAVKGVRLGLLG